MSGGTWPRVAASTTHRWSIYGGSGGAILHREGALAPKLPRDVGGMGLHGDAEFAYTGPWDGGSPDPANGNVIDNFGLAWPRSEPPLRKRSFAANIGHAELWCQGFSDREPALIWAASEPEAPWSPTDSG